MASPSFAELARAPDPALDALALALAGEFREVHAEEALALLDDLGAEVADAASHTGGDPEREARACADVLGGRHGFAGDSEAYDDPANSMLDLVLQRRRGLPILLSVVYVAVARRADIALDGVGLPGHYVVGHFGTTPPVLLDPFAGGAVVETDAPPELVRQWTPHETALRMLTNLVASYKRRGDVSRSIRAAELRLVLPLDAQARTALEAEVRALRARLN